MFKPKYIKQARLLQKGVKKFLKYKEDILPEDKRTKIDGLSAEFDAAVTSRDKELVKTKAKELTKACEQSVPVHKNSAIRENVEVIFVAFVIAIGIRSYFLQPFKIPTGSMQPTLNGVKATAFFDDPEFERPNIVGRVLSKTLMGRSWVDITMEKEGVLTSIDEKTRFKFFTYTLFEFEDKSQNFTIPAPIAVVMKDTDDDGFGVARRILGATSTSGSTQTARLPKTIPAGTVIAQGKIDTGDQVLVDKFSYHFRRPNRGEVFVFNTRRIEGIKPPDPNQKSQHYIKRLAGVPGDIVEVRPREGEAVSGQPHIPADLIINGEKATENGFVRVDKEHGGYVFVRDFRFKKHKFDLTEGSPESRQYGERPFVALGDNSRNSSDSRAWGVVSEQNLVGPAMFVYWPFTNHWGPIN